MSLNSLREENRSYGRGDKLSGAARVTVGTGLSYASAARYFSSPLLSAAPGLGLITRAAVPLTGAVLSVLGSVYVAGKVGQGLRFMAKADRQIRSLQMGGCFEESFSSKASRMRAVEEIGTSLNNSRSYLGREAMFMHR